MSSRRFRRVGGIRQSGQKLSHDRPRDLLDEVRLDRNVPPVRRNIDQQPPALSFTDAEAKRRQSAHRLVAPDVVPEEPASRDGEASAETVDIVDDAAIETASDAALEETAEGKK